ncbi:MAG TPA: DUF2155 domain-containing protein [Rhizomicrobium sp.]|jgi:hypothetical protein|nr:DUF2155 domain-containing protein [Rhizomicrobium sp.]
MKAPLVMGWLMLGGIAVAMAQPAPASAPAPTRPANGAAPAPAAPADATAPEAPPQPLANAPGTTLMLRGLDKITGKPTNIEAPIGKPVQFATLTITARYCYSTPASETPETSAFIQIDDHRPDQSEKRVFSGWMYASSPGLNGMQHPLYDVWVINCSNGAPNTPVAAMSSTAPVKVASPDSSDKDKIEALPAEAGR